MFLSGPSGRCTPPLPAGKRPARLLRKAWHRFPAAGPFSLFGFILRAPPAFRNSQPSRCAKISDTSPLLSDPALILRSSPSPSASGRLLLRLLRASPQRPVARQKRLLGEPLPAQPFSCSFADTPRLPVAQQSAPLQCRQGAHTVKIHIRIVDGLQRIVGRSRFLQGPDPLFPQEIHHAGT